MGKTRSESPMEPIEETKEEAEERFADNLAELRRARDVARDAFKMVVPTLEQVIGIRATIASGVLEGVIVPTVAKALRIGPKYGVKDTVEVLTLVDILLDDDDAEEHIEATVEEARNLFGDVVDAKTLFAVYYQIYGEDEVSDRPGASSPSEEGSEGR